MQIYAHYSWELFINTISILKNVQLRIELKEKQNIFSLGESFFLGNIT